MITKNKALIATLFTFGILVSCNLHAFVGNLSVLGNRDTRDIIVLVGDIHYAAPSDMEVQQVKAIVRGAIKAQERGRMTDIFIEGGFLHGMVLSREFLENYKLPVKSRCDLLFELPFALTKTLEEINQTIIKFVDPRQNLCDVLLSGMWAMSIEVSIVRMENLYTKYLDLIRDLHKRIDPMINLNQVQRRVLINIIKASVKAWKEVALDIMNGKILNRYELRRRAYVFIKTSPLEAYLYYELCRSKNNLHVCFYGSGHMEKMKGVLIEEGRYEELASYGISQKDLEKFDVTEKDPFSFITEPGNFHTSMHSHLEKVMGMTHEELWALELEPKPHRMVKSKL